MDLTKDLIGGIGKGIYRARNYDPEVTVKEIVPHPINAQLGVKLSIKNLNSFPMEVRGVSYKVVKASDDTAVADGSTDEIFAIPMDSAVDFEVPIHCTWTGIKAVGSSLYNRGETELQIKGQVTVHAQVMGDIHIPYGGDVKVVW